MLGIILWPLMGMFVWGFASCSITCPDGKVCSDHSTCCFTEDGYECCPYPHAVCCTDLIHCCPSGFRCNLVTQMCEREKQLWVKIPMVKKEAAKERDPLILPLSPLQELKNNHIPDQKKSSVVHCDNYSFCPDGTNCCRHPAGVWSCCPYSSGQCCLDGFHCCPNGYDCDFTYQHCVKKGLRYPFSPKQSLPSVSASLISPSEDKANSKGTPMTALTEAIGSTPRVTVIICDSKFYCNKGMSCCKGPTDQWMCCPYPLGQCCQDGKHCCEYGYNCGPSSLSCRRFYSQVPSGTQEHARAA